MADKQVWAKPEPQKQKTSDSSIYSADLAHERTLEYFVHNTELGVLDKDQMGVISLVNAGQTLGMCLPAAAIFFEKIRMLSSGENGVGRVQVKEVITAGAFPMSLLFGDKPSGILETIKGLLGKRTEPAQPGSR